jgi:putative ATP-dependent endonuclease of the OLD family
MRVTKIRVQNFRLLRDISIDLEEELSVIIGKNNCGKTSLLLILEKFIGSGYSKNSFSFDDFNINFKEELKSRIEGPESQPGAFPFMGISLKLFIEYNEQDDLSNIGNKVIMDLDPENRVVVLVFDYYLLEERLEALKKDYIAYCAKRTADKKKPKEIFSFLKEHHTGYFKLSRKSLHYNMELQKEDEAVFTDLLKEKIQLDKIISFKWISARRSVSNKDSEKALSSQSSRIYKKLEANSNNPAVIEEFKDTLSNTDDDLNKIYETLFQEVIDDVRRFGGIKQDDSIIKIVSSLQHKELFEENTTVMYGLGTTDHTLPENYNGLGYMNLISMIFEIKILLHDFQKEKDEKPSDINLLFIEEPEVHTHPQMQRIFIKNIKSLLQNGIEREDGENRKLQTILSTHSSHIISESDFEDIKYFKKNTTGIISKNLKDLKNEYDAESAYYKFLKQYLTLHRSELFFADKAIFIEGDTERILLPAIMKKLDQKDALCESKEGLNPSLPLLSQNVSVIEVGAYSQIFEKFINYLGIKSLVITDIDSVKTVPQTADNGEVKKNKDGTDKTKDESCPVSDGTKTSNSSLKFFYGNEKSLNDLKNLSLGDRIMEKSMVGDTFKWAQNKKGHLLCVYQTIEKNDAGENYYARSFEDAFFHINKKFISEHTFDEIEVFIGKETFPSLNQTEMQQFAKSQINAWEMAKAVSKKPPFAMEILLNSTNKKIAFKPKDLEEASMTLEYSNWNIPAYIREGLQWLKQD